MRLKYWAGVTDTVMKHRLMPKPSKTPLVANSPATLLMAKLLRISESPTNVMPSMPVF